MADITISVTLEHSVDVVLEQSPVEIVSEASVPFTIIRFGDRGLKGDKGDTGTITWTGEGAPGVIEGARTEDLYLDLLTGNLYELEE